MQIPDTSVAAGSGPRILTQNDATVINKLHLQTRK